MIELLLPAWLAGMLLTLIIGPLGAFIIWRKMSYIGESLAHISLLGVSCGLLFNINLYYSIILIIIIFTFLLIWLSNIPQLEVDTLLGIIAHSALSLGLVVISGMHNIRMDLFSYLFGDVLAVTNSDVIIIMVYVIVISILIIFNWNYFLAITIHQELSFIDGIKVKYNKILLFLITAFTIGIAMKFIGALIITSLLIIPSATSNYISKTPEEMVGYAIIFGMLSVTFGLLLSVIFDTPVGPSIVLISSALFILILFLKLLVIKMKKLKK
uniref:High-affinity zinc uptake system membrane protein ZnuB n=1 Tax=Candidatus Aschnera chinzeii TaxID=1485666 RepID=A0AAT9G4W8_9ENTR|nr:MAG: zinc ABC transporter permease subunit ZnuB [Candidatus Aschnera chinzeii]